MDAALALFAAFLFAVAATLQQKGALNLPKVSLTDPSSLLKLIGQTMWLCGTIALLCGYVVQAIALDEGRLSIIQPLLVTTVVFALPLGYWLTNQHVGPKEIIGAAVIMAGLALFTVFADPAGGNENAPDAEWAIVIVLIAIASACCCTSAVATAPTRAHAPRSTARWPACCSACRPSLTKPTLSFLSDSVGDDAVALAAVRVGRRRDPRLRAAAGVARHRAARAVGRNGVDGQPGRRHPHRHGPARRNVEPTDVAHRRRGIGLVVALVGAVVISLSSEAGRSPRRTRRPPTRSRRTTAPTGVSIADAGPTGPSLVSRRH